MRNILNEFTKFYYFDAALKVGSKLKPTQHAKIGFIFAAVR